MAADTRTIQLSPFARIEGDLRLSLEVEAGRVREARAAGTLFRGFETILRGRPAVDAMVFLPRVCGQCSLTHTAAAAAAIHSLHPRPVPSNGRLAASVMLGAECLIGHLAHFYLTVGPDLACLSGAEEHRRRFAVPVGTATARALAARHELQVLLGLFAGKWPNSLAIQPGGTSRSLDASELLRARSVLFGLRQFLETQLLGDRVEAWLELHSRADLLRWIERPGPAGADLGLLVRLALDHGLECVGRGPERYLSCGGFQAGDGQPWLKPGFLTTTSVPLDLDQVREDVSHAWYTPQPEGPVHPSQGTTQPDTQRAEAYSWIKAPRYQEAPAETGPLARQLCDSDPLLSDLVRARGSNALTRLLARLHETVRLTRQLDVWLDEIQPDQPFCAEVKPPPDGEGSGFLEAPRGMLSHHLSLQAGRLRNYQIVTPTAWNFSPRDQAGQPGPVEAALVGTPVPETGPAPLVSLVVKSFDPCMYCAVH